MDGFEEGIPIQLLFHPYVLSWLRALSASFFRLFFSPVTSFPFKGLSRWHVL